MKLLKKMISMGAAVAMLIGASACSPQEKLVIGGKEYTEQRILAHLISELIEDRTDIQVERKDGLGGTLVVYNALKAGSIDLYIEYSGTVYVTIFGNETSSDMEYVYNQAKTLVKDENNFDVLSQFGFNNTYVMAVTQEFAQLHNLEKISDLIPIADELHGGFTYEFINRQDGLIGMEETYGFEVGEVSAFEGTLRYQALENGNINITTAFGTDSLIQKLNLVALEDDLSFFPPYYAFPMLRGGILEKYPILADLSDELAAVLNNDAAMIALNYQVDELQLEPREVARAFLIEQGLIDAD